MNRDAWRRILEHARQDYPSECCGIVTRDHSGKHQVHRCLNIQDRLHAHDPEAHPRTSAQAYRMDGLQVCGILDEAGEAGGSVVVFYHSHIDCGAYFSEEDKCAAASCGAPTYPGVAYLVVSVVNGEIGEQRGFRWDGREVNIPLGV